MTTSSTTAVEIVKQEAVSPQVITRTEPDNLLVEDMSVEFVQPCCGLFDGCETRYFEAMSKLESCIHPSKFMAMAPPVCAAAPRRSSEKTAIGADEGSL